MEMSKNGVFITAAWRQRSLLRVQKLLNFEVYILYTICKSAYNCKETNFVKWIWNFYFTLLPMPNRRARFFKKLATHFFLDSTLQFWSKEPLKTIMGCFLPKSPELWSWRFGGFTYRPLIFQSSGDLGKKQPLIILRGFLLQNWRVESKKSEPQISKHPCTDSHT